MPLLARILDATVDFVPRRLARPLVLSSGPIHELTEAQTTVRVRIEGGGFPVAGASGGEATGRGSIYLSDLWSWPDP
ncbi:MAG: hypothetical protein NTW19_09590, partial [Planctomycetota bacterium]|nr:hypothetical protein [Planctomycetota bacterium]